MSSNGNDGRQLLQQSGDGLEAGNVQVRDDECLNRATAKDGEERY